MQYHSRTPGDEKQCEILRDLRGPVMQPPDGVGGTAGTQTRTTAK